MNYGSLYLFMLVGNSALGQSAQVDTLQPQTRQPKIQTMEQFMTVKLTQSSDAERLGVQTPATTIRLRPNASSETRLGFTYRFIDVGVSFVPRFLPGNNDDEEKGKTTGTGLSASFVLRHWIQELAYKRTRGFYLENTVDFNAAWRPGMPYVQIPDLVFTQYRGATAYNFNPQFSVNAVLFQSERQLKSAGSFIPQFLYRYYVIDDRSPITPNGFTQKSGNLELLLGAGYHYTLVIARQWYASLGLTPNIGYLLTRLDTRSRTESFKSSQNNFMFRFDGRAGIGYNGPRFFAGAYLNWQNASYRQQHTAANTRDDYAIYHVSVGYRLKAPGWLKDGLDNMIRKTGLK